MGRRMNGDERERKIRIRGREINEKIKVKVTGMEKKRA